MDVHKSSFVDTWCALQKHISVNYSNDEKRLFMSVLAWLYFGDNPATMHFQGMDMENGQVKQYVEQMIGTFDNLQWDYIGWSLYFKCYFKEHDGRCCSRLKIISRVRWSPQWSLEGLELLKRIPVHRIDCLRQMATDNLPNIGENACIDLYGTCSDMYVCLPETMYHKRGLRYLVRNGLVHVVECHKDASVLYACKEWEMGLQFIRKKIHEEKEYPKREISWFDARLPECVQIQSNTLDISKISERIPGRISLNSLPISQASILWWMMSREQCQPKEWLGVRINGQWVSPFIRDIGSSPSGGVIACDPGVGVIAPILRICQRGKTIVITSQNLVQSWLDNEIEAYPIDYLEYNTVSTTRLIVDVKRFKPCQLDWLSRCDAKIIWWLSHPRVDITTAKNVCRWDVKVSQRLTTETFILARQLILYMTNNNSRTFLFRYIWCTPNKAEKESMSRWRNQACQLYSRRELFDSAWEIESSGTVAEDVWLNNFQCRRSKNTNILPKRQKNGQELKRCCQNDQMHALQCGHSFCDTCSTNSSDCPVCNSHSPIQYSVEEAKFITHIDVKRRKFISWARGKDMSNVILVGPTFTQNLHGMPDGLSYDISGDGYCDKTLVYWEIPHGNESLHIPKSENDIYILVIRGWIANHWVDNERMSRSDIYNKWIGK